MTIAGSVHFLVARSRQQTAFLREMGLLKRLKFGSAVSMPSPLKLNRKNKPKSINSRRKSIFSLISISDITEASLQVWRQLPIEIRDDPSLASFQLENNRLHGGENYRKINQPNDIQINSNEYGEQCDMENYLALPLSGSIRNNSSIGDISTSDQCSSQDGSICRTTPTKSPDPTSKRKNIKLVSLFLIWLFSVIVLMRTEEKSIDFHLIAIPGREIKDYTLPIIPLERTISIRIDGPFVCIKINGTNNKDSMTIELVHKTVQFLSKSIDKSSVELSTDLNGEICRFTKSIKLSKFDFKLLQLRNDKESNLKVRFFHNHSTDIAIRIGYDYSVVDMEYGPPLAALVLIMMYILMIWEIVHRTFAAILASTTSLALLALLNDRPTMVDIIDWIDVETLLLLFSMMILVAILTETGIFDHLSIYCFQMTNGRIWPLIYCLCLTTAFISMLLDNVTTILLMTPITIRLCEVIGLNPLPILMAIIVHANIGGTATPIGDPPNIMITTNKHFAQSGVTFLTFILHMSVGVILVIAQTAIHLRILYRDVHQLRTVEPKEVKELRHEISVWKRAAGSMSSYSKDADVVRNSLLKRVKSLKHKLKKKELTATVSSEAYQTTLEDLRRSYPIKNKKLLIKSGLVLIMVLTLFFIQSIPAFQRLSLGWCALLGVILLLIISDKQDMDSLLKRIEWTTLLFFAGMFVTMEAMERLRLIEWIGRQTERIIMAGPKDARLAIAITMILWISAIASSIVDSIPITAMMIKIVVGLSGNRELNLPMQPLVWALAFGPCLGGNGTLYGASANVVCAGIAEQHGYKISFVAYFKKCFPIMIGSVCIITAYLMVAHVLFTWH